MSDLPTALFLLDDTLRSRRVSDVVLTGTVDIPAPPARLLADWAREITTRMVLAPGDVEPMPLARARMRWPDYSVCVSAAQDWSGAMGLPGVLAASEIALMTCLGARYHHDGEQYGGAVFCNLFLSDDCGLDVHFPHAGHRMPLQRGTMMVFDTCQPHAVILRGSSGFDAADFVPAEDYVQMFLTWEIPIDDPHVARAFGIEIDACPTDTARHTDEQVLVNGMPAHVCPASGRWLVD